MMFMRDRPCIGIQRATILTVSLLLSTAYCVHGQVPETPQPTAMPAMETASPTSSPTTSTTPTTPVIEGGDCVTDYDADAGVDYFPVKADIEYATMFSVEYSLSYKMLTATDGKTGNASVYVLYQCGTPQPTLNGTIVEEYISIPVTRVATGVPDHIPRIELLGHRDTLVAFTGNTSVIGSPCVDALVEDGEVVQATTSNDTCSSYTDNAVLMDLDVDVAFGDTRFTSFCVNDTNPTYNGVGVASFFETGPNTGLAHGEMIKFFSLFYNDEEAANEIFDEIEFLWNCTLTNSQGCSLQLDDVPDVAYFNYVPTDPAFGEGWGVPKDNVSYTYAIRYAGGNPITCPDVDPDAFLMTDEEMLDCFANATVCIFAADYDKVVEVYGTSVLDQLPCVQNNRVYDFMLSGVNAWFEAITVEPHVLLEDMVVVLHGDDFNYGLGSYERLLLRNVTEEESGSGTYYADVGTCDDPDAVLELQGECNIIVDYSTCNSTLLADSTSRAARTVPGMVGGGAPWAVACALVLAVAGFA